MQGKRINFLAEHPEFERLPLSGKRKRLFLFVIALLCVGILLVVRALLPPPTPENPHEYNPITLEPKEPEGIFGKLKNFVFKKEVALEGQKDDRINILLLGMGGPGHDGPYLTDTIMIASIKPSAEQIGIISIPRDVAVEIPGNGIRKINHANALGEAKRANWGGAFATEVVEKNLNLDIHYYARIDFAAFQEVIDAVGGITVNVERAFTDAEFPATNEQYQTVSFQKGVQQMDGERALQYARSRHGTNGEGSDFARAARQQKVLLALREKLFSFNTLANPVRIYEIMQSVESHLTTNMEFSDMIALLKMGKELQIDQIHSLVLDNSPDGYLQNTHGTDGAFLLAPKTGSFEEISAAIHQIFENPSTARTDDTPAQVAPALSRAAVEIQNGTWNAGLAARVKKRLDEKNFIVATISNTEERPVAGSGIYRVSDTPARDVAQALQQELNIPIKQTTTNTLAASTTDILIILGEDFIEETY